MTDRVLAQVLVVSDPAHPDPKDAFVAALGGRLLVPTDFLKGSGRHGVAIRYERALRLPRYLWVSPACEMKFAAALQVMRQMCQHAGQMSRAHGGNLTHRMSSWHGAGARLGNESWWPWRLNVNLPTGTCADTRAGPQ